MRTTITTKKLKCISVSPPEMSTSAAEPVSRPIEADTERHLREAGLHPANDANASIASHLRDVPDRSAAVLGDRVHGDDHDVQPQQDPDHLVAAAPVLVGQGAAVGQQGAQARQHPAQPARRRVGPAIQRSAHVSGFAFSTNACA